MTSTPDKDSPEWDARAADMIKPENVERLAQIYEHGEYPLDKSTAATLRALSAALQAVEADRDNYKEAYLDAKRLAREIDVALHGEENAARQASLCDLVEPARRLRKELEGKP